MSIIDELKKIKCPFSLMSPPLQTKAHGIGRQGNFQYWNGQVWITLTDKGDFKLELAYRLRADYEDEPERLDKVFASTTDSEKDSMNNVIGVTAHCKCGNVFCDDVVHGKSQRQAHKNIYKLAFWRKKQP